MSAIVSVVVGASASITAGAALGTFRYARTAAEIIAENEQRSKTNREMLVGEPETLEGPVVDRLRDVEDSLN